MLHMLLLEQGTCLTLPLPPMRAHNLLEENNTAQATAAGKPEAQLLTKALFKRIEEL